MELPGVPEAPAEEGGMLRRSDTMKSTRSAKSKRVGELQTKLNALLREDAIDWEQVRDLMCYEDCLNPNFTDYRSSVATVHRAAYDGAAEVLRWCIERGADVNGKTAIGRAPLHYACNGNRPSCIRELLEHRADPNLESLSSMTPLHVACHSGSYEAVLELFKAPEPNDLDVEDSHRRTAEQLTSSVLIKRAIRKYRSNLDEIRKKTLPDTTPAKKQPSRVAMRLPKPLGLLKMPEPGLAVKFLAAVSPRQSPVSDLPATQAAEPQIDEVAPDPVPAEAAELPPAAASSPAVASPSTPTCGDTGEVRRASSVGASKAAASAGPILLSSRFYAPRRGWKPAEEAPRRAGVWGRHLLRPVTAVS